MSLTTAARRKLFQFVQAAKKLLIDDIDSQLKQFYGFQQNGTYGLVEELTSTDADIVYVARTLRQRHEHIQSQ